MSRLRELASELRAELAGFEPNRFSGDDCALISEELAATQKACAAASAAAAKRAVECNAHRGRGFTGGVEWVARTTGSTPGEARSTLRTTGELANCLATSEAVKSGAVSLAQAREIVGAEAAVPGSEVALLGVAATTGMAGLREESRRVRLGSMDRDALHAEQYRSRSVTHGIDSLGMVTGQIPPASGSGAGLREPARSRDRPRAARREHRGT